MSQQWSLNRNTSKPLGMWVTTTVVVSLCLSSCTTEPNQPPTPMVIAVTVSAPTQVVGSIGSEADAVAVASRHVGVELTWQGEPRVLAVERTTVAQAADRLKELGYTGQLDDPSTTEVWLVVFQGQFRIQSPNGSMLPPETGCVAVVEAIDQSSYMRQLGFKCAVP